MAGNRSRTLTSAAIKDQITEAFVRRARADAGQIKVDIGDEGVVLRGHVPTSMEREAAEEAVWALPDVDSVVNDLEVVGDDSNHLEI